MSTFTKCSTPTEGQYVSTICFSGSTIGLKPAVKGSDTAFTKCSTPTEGQYVSTICSSGSNTEAGSDTALKSWFSLSFYFLVYALIIFYSTQIN